MVGSGGGEGVGALVLGGGEGAGALVRGGGDCSVPAASCVSVVPAAAGSGVCVPSPPVRPAMMMRPRMSAPVMAHQRLYQAV